MRSPAGVVVIIWLIIIIGSFFAPTSKALTLSKRDCVQYGGKVVTIYRDGKPTTEWYCEFGPNDKTRCKGEGPDNCKAALQIQRAPFKLYQGLLR